MENIQAKLSGFGDELPIGEVAGVHDPAQGVGEDARVVAVVVPPLKLFEVAVHVLLAHLVERAYQRPLEEAPHVLDVVSVNVTHNPLFVGVVNGFVAGVIVGNSQVGFKIIGVDRFGLILDRAPDELMESVSLDVRDALQADLATALDRSGHPGLVLPVAAPTVSDLGLPQAFRQPRPRPRV